MPRGLGALRPSRQFCGGTSCLNALGAVDVNANSYTSATLTAGAGLVTSGLQISAGVFPTPASYLPDATTVRFNTAPQSEGNLLQVTCPTNVAVGAGQQSQTGLTPCHLALDTSLMSFAPPLVSSGLAVCAEGSYFPCAVTSNALIMFAITIPLQASDQRFGSITTTLPTYGTWANVPALVVASADTGIPVGYTGYLQTATVSWNPTTPTPPHTISILFVATRVSPSLAVNTTGQWAADDPLVQYCYNHGPD